ncbi:MAG: hypothetical protein OES57_01000, partial [Acidimicrobiia bacterium]|nr:hypothetical protein [Acidimicrobiia bacterium]
MVRLTGSRSTVMRAHPGATAAATQAGMCTVYNRIDARSAGSRSSSFATASFAHRLPGIGIGGRPLANQFAELPAHRGPPVFITWTKK